MALMWTVAGTTKQVCSRHEVAPWGSLPPRPHVKMMCGKGCQVIQQQVEQHLNWQLLLTEQHESHLRIP